MRIADCRFRIYLILICYIRRIPKSYNPKSEIIKCGSSSGVEHQLPKLRVEGSNPFSRSNKRLRKQPFIIYKTDPDLSGGGTCK